MIIEIDGEEYTLNYASVKRVDTKMEVVVHGETSGITLDGGEIVDPEGTKLEITYNFNTRGMSNDRKRQLVRRLSQGDVQYHTFTGLPLPVQQGGGLSNGDKFKVKSVSANFITGKNGEVLFTDVLPVTLEYYGYWRK